MKIKALLLSAVLLVSAVPVLSQTMPGGGGSSGGGTGTPGGATNTTQYNAGGGTFGGVGPGTTTTLLHGNAAGAPTFSAVDLNADVTNNLAVSHLNSGTGASSSTYWRGDGTWATPAGAGTVTSVAQSFTGGLISISGSPITGAGTLASTVAGTSGGIVYFSSASTWASSAALAANAIVIGGGAGVAPSTTTTAAGVLSFLGTPTSANLAAALTDETGTGANVFANGPTLIAPILGTPASGNASNLTSIPVANATGILPAANGGAGTVSGIMQANGSGLVAAATLGNGLSYSSPKLSLTNTLDNQTGTTFVVPPTDAGAIITASNASAQAYSIVQATTAGFTSGYGTTISNIGAGTVTLTAATSTFGNGLTALGIAPGQVADIGSNGANYPFTAMSLPVMAQDTLLGNPNAANYPTAMTLPACASDGAHGLTYASHALACTAISGGAASITVNTSTITGGTGGRLVFDNAGTFGEISQLTNSSGALTLSTAGAASTPAFTLSGAPFTGGTATTTFPQLYINSGAAVTSFATTGTALGINLPSASTANFEDYHVNGGASVYKVNSAGLVTATGLDLSGAATQDINLNATSNINIAGANKISFFAGDTYFNVGHNVYGNGGNSWGLYGVAASATVPSMGPNNSSPQNTGWGAATATSISGIISGVEKFRLTTEGIQYKQATAPVVTGTGSPTIATGSTDEAGEVTSGTSATSVIITFNLTHTNAPFCVVTPHSVLAVFTYSLSSTAITITQTATSAEKIDYRCSFP